MQVWYVSILKMLKNTAGYGILFWAPILINAMLQGSQVSAPPFLLAPAHIIPLLAIVVCKQLRSCSMHQSVPG
jgi:hypothetical protein